MSSLTKVNVEEDADGFIDSSSFWIELSTSSVSDISVPSFAAARPFVERPAASPVYFGSVSLLDWNLPIRREANLGKQVIHLSKAFIFLTRGTSHKNTLVIVVYAGPADDNFAAWFGPSHLPFAGLL
jgi:hypothetical protein